MKIFLVWLVLFVSSVQAQNEWFLGKWQAVVPGSIYTLENRSDGTYYFSGDDGTSLYEETGTWQLSDNQFTQNWTDQNTGLPTSATYTLEKLSDTAFNQFGGNLGEGFVFNFSKVSSGTLTPKQQGDNPLGGKPGTTPNETITGTTPTNPLQIPEATTTETTAPPPAVDPTVTQDFIVGEWIAREDNSLFHFNVREDGSYTWEISNWKGEVSYSEVAKWELENGRLKQTWQNKQPGLTETSYYEPERVSDNALRWRGGNFGLNTALFYRVLPDQLSPSSSWLVGYWSGFFGITAWGFTFQADGSYTLDITPFNEETQTLRGMWTLEHEKLTLSGDKAATYDLSYHNEFTIYINGADLGDSDNLFQRANQDPRDPYYLPSFVGQYLQQDNTLTISYDGTKYGGNWLQKEQLYTLTEARVENDLLTFIAVGADGQAYPHTFRLYNNGLQEQGDFLLNAYFQKISETTLPTTNELMSYWIQTEGFSQDDDLLLLPDGRYYQSSYFELAGQTSQSVTEGLYTLGNDQLTLDPSCAEPSTYTTKQIENHLLLSFAGFDGNPVSSTYMAAPATSTNYQLVQAQLRGEIEARLNAEWEQKISLAPVNTSIGRIPPSGEISVDEFPTDVFPNATIFAEQELYPYQSDYFYFYDKNGAFRSGTQGMMMIDPGFADQMDISKGQYYDKQNTYFFPNGRTMTYSESYLTATKITYPPTPNVQFFWNKYRIEENQIMIGEGDTQTVYELLNGRRHIRLGEQCYENIEFSVATIKQ